MKKKLQYIFSNESEKFRPSILDFWERTTGDASVNHYDSYYLNNPYGETNLGLCFDDDKLVGTENYIPHRVSYQGQLLNAQLGADTLVDPDYRLFHGVFGKLCKLTIEELTESSDILYATHNDASKKYYIKHFGWSVSTTLDYYKKITYPDGFNLKSLLCAYKPGRQFKDLRLEKTPEFSSQPLNDVIENYHRSSNQAYFYKSTEFLNWKFLSNKKYSIDGYIIHFKDKVTGYVITHQKGNELKVIDILVENNDEEILRKTLLTLSRMATRNKKTNLSIVATPNAWYRPSLEKLGFFHRWSTDYVSLSSSNTVPDDAWVVQLGDLDVF